MTHAAHLIYHTPSIMIWTITCPFAHVSLTLPVSPYPPPLLTSSPLTPPLRGSHGFGAIGLGAAGGKRRGPTMLPTLAIKLDAYVKKGADGVSLGPAYEDLDDDGNFYRPVKSTMRSTPQVPIHPLGLYLSLSSPYLRHCRHPAGALREPCFSVSPAARSLPFFDWFLSLLDFAHPPRLIQQCA